MTVAGSPDRVDDYRSWYYICLGLVALCYILYIIFLRPKNLLLFLLNSLAVVLLLMGANAARLSGSSSCGLNIGIGLVLLYLTWRSCRWVYKRLN